MAICRLMLLCFTTGEPKYGQGWDSYDLHCGISYARWRLEEGYQYFSHDDHIPCRAFIKWANNKLKARALA